MFSGLHLNAFSASINSREAFLVRGGKNDSQSEYVIVPEGFQLTHNNAFIYGNLTVVFDALVHDCITVNQILAFDNYLV